MAIGDAISLILGTAETPRQPASGVEEQISMIVKESGNDRIDVYNGTTVVQAFLGTVRTYGPNDASADDFNATPYNMAWMLTNSVYMRKSGTTDNIYIGGVQTNA